VGARTSPRKSSTGDLDLVRDRGRESRGAVEKRGVSPETLAGIGQTPVAGKPAIMPANTPWLWRKRASWFQADLSIPEWAQNGASLRHNDA
jgi:hypothetical protein